MKEGTNYRLRTIDNVSITKDIFFVTKLQKTNPS